MLQVHVPAQDGTSNGGAVDVVGYVVPTGDNTQDLVAAIGFQPIQGAVSRVSFGAPAPGQVNKSFSGVVALSTTVTTTVNLEVVTSGKQFYPTDIIITTNAAGASNVNILAQLQYAAVSAFSSYVNNTKGIETTGLESPPPAAAGQQVSLVFGVASAAGNAAYNVYGIEQ